MKTGKHPAVHNQSTMRRALAVAAAFKDLPAAPLNSADYVAAVDRATGGGWGLFKNDVWGCCVVADRLHQRMLYTANTGAMIMPSDSEVLPMYQKLCPGFDPNAPVDQYGENPTDQGASELDCCNIEIAEGELTSAGVIDPKNIKHVQWGIQLYGTVKIGIQLPDFAETYFDQDKVWDMPIGKPPNFVGGHDVPVVQYRMDGATLLLGCVTWGRLQWMTTGFLLACCDEVHLPNSIMWTRKLGVAPSGYSFGILDAALQQAVATS
jgi:hypothetical protein